MSEYCNLGGETLWNPSQGASRMFRRHVALFEAELGLPSGIGSMGDSDEFRIDPAALATFVTALLERHRRTTRASRASARTAACGWARSTARSSI
ncbi:DUF6086 family protein [Streptomyces thermolilacinus]|uniref:Uncharacterized protein n=1 Tax=Streptomyces thermolilacinus SPC6 TaxID=1306406 RepID=A0A1D3DZ35_9ACTN|nr:DUF6086 family protein [Streptomyces thermolilacinus]OEJ97593.1 hypothetical protein J116_027200 [Streptomyces thermolilacinus SPC6]